MAWLLLPLKRYAQFSGRSQRQEYWTFVLFTMIVSVVLAMVEDPIGRYGGGRMSGNFLRLGPLGAIFALATLLPSLAVAVRRLHDTSRSAWWLLMPVGVLVAGFTILVAVTIVFGGANWPGLEIGVWVLMAAGFGSLVVLFVFFCFDGTRGTNRFGDDPKGVSYEGVFD